MRIFLAGATGVIGRRLLPLLEADGHDVFPLSRAVCDVFDREKLIETVEAFAPDLVMHQLTDLPDDVSEIASYAARNDRIRTEGTANLVAAAAGARVLAQSIAWTPPGRGAAVAGHEQQVLDVGGVLVRYGQLYGPGTYYEDGLPDHPRIHVDEAARRTVPLLDAPSGVVVLAEDS